MKRTFLLAIATTWLLTLSSSYCMDQIDRTNKEVLNKKFLKALIAKDTVQVQALIGQGAEVNCNINRWIKLPDLKEDIMALSPINITTMNKDYRTTLALLALGAKPNSCFQSAIKIGDIDLVQLALTFVASSPVTQALPHADIDYLRKLATVGVDLHQTLAIATEPERVRALVAMKVNINKTLNYISNQLDTRDTYMAWEMMTAGQFLKEISRKRSLKSFLLSLRRKKIELAKDMINHIITFVK